MPITFAARDTDYIAKLNALGAGGGGSGSSVTVGTSPPSTPAAGDMWWKADEGRLKVYYDDGSSTQWVDAFALPEAVEVRGVNPMTTAGDLIVGGTAGVETRLAAGATSGHVLTSNGASTAPSYQAVPAGFTNPMTTTGDIIVGGSSGTAGRLAAGATSGHVLTSTGSGSAPSWQAAAGGAAAGLQGVRLYATTGVPVPASDTTTVSTIYVGAFGCNTVTVLDGSDNLVALTISEHSLALSGLTSGKAYDVFLYSNAGTPTVELSAAWTNDTTRADALALVKGIYVKSSAHTRLHVGTIYTTGTTSTADTAAKRFMWNRFNQRLAYMAVQETGVTNWAYSTATIRQANANAANQLDYVTGDAGTVADARAYVPTLTTVAATFSVGIGLDSTTTDDSSISGSNQTNNIYTSLSAFYSGRPGLGRHRLVWVEKGGGTGTQTWYSRGSGDGRSGIAGTLWN